MCAGHGRGAIETYLSEKWALAKKHWETLDYSKITERLKQDQRQCADYSNKSIKLQSLEPKAN